MLITVPDAASDFITAQTFQRTELNMNKFEPISTSNLSIYSNKYQFTSIACITGWRLSVVDCPPNCFLFRFWPRSWTIILDYGLCNIVEHQTASLVKWVGSVWWENLFIVCLSEVFSFLFFSFLSFVPSAHDCNILKCFLCIWSAFLFFFSWRFKTSDSVCSCSYSRKCYAYCVCVFCFILQWMVKIWLLRWMFS